MMPGYALTHGKQQFKSMTEARRNVTTSHVMLRYLVRTLHSLYAYSHGVMLVLLLDYPQAIRRGGGAGGDKIHASHTR